MPDDRFPRSPGLRALFHRYIGDDPERIASFERDLAEEDGGVVPRNEAERQVIPDRLPEEEQALPATGITPKGRLVVLLKRIGLKENTSGSIWSNQADEFIVTDDDAVILSNGRGYAGAYFVFEFTPDGEFIKTRFDGPGVYPDSIIG